MDRLDEMWKIQSDFCSKINYGSKEQGTKELALHIVSELDEVLNEISWKVHRKQKKVYIMSNLLEEIIDLQKFVWSIATLWGFSADQMYDEFKRKSDVVEQLWNQEMLLDNLENNERIVGVDIDGVLADYSTGFFNFLGKEKGLVFSGVSVPRDLLSKGYASLTEYEEWKHDFRSGGYKRDLPVINGAAEFVSWLKKEGYGVVLLTSRPYKRYKRIFADTIGWLKEHGIIYDAIIFDEEKNMRLYREYGNKVKFFVEDEAEKAGSIAKVGIRVYLVDKPYNRVSYDGVIRVSSLRDIMERESYSERK